MAVESDADRAALLADFGVECEVTLAAGKTVTLTGILDKEFVEVITEFGRSVESQGPMLAVRSSDVTDVAHGDDLEIGTTAYKIREIEPDGTGMTILKLEEQ